MVGLQYESQYKPLRPSQILNSEKMVSAVIAVLEDEYLNPFDIFIEKMQLFNLSSCIPVQHNEGEILDIYKSGKVMSHKFMEERIHSSIKSFHDPITRNKVPLFQNLSKSIKIRKNTASKVIEVNRNIIGKLLSLSVKAHQPIDFEKALEYPLSPVPLSISNPDSSRWVTQKSKLIEILLSFSKPSHNGSISSNPNKEDVSAFVIDMIAQIRMLTKEVPDSYEELAISVPSNSVQF